MKQYKQLGFEDSLHFLGRIFTAISLVVICLVPVVYCIAANVMPDWKVVLSCALFIVGYMAIGLIEAVSYAPLLGTGGQYLSFITGNISNLKLPCALNAQTILKTEQGSEEQEVITTIAISVSSIVTTVIIAIGLIPLALWQSDIVRVLEPVTPYVIPSIFGGLGVVLLSRYFKLTIIPFAICLVVCIVAFAIGRDLGQSTMITVGMVISLIAGTLIYRRDRKKSGDAPAKKQSGFKARFVKKVQNAVDRAETQDAPEDDNQTK